MRIKELFGSWWVLAVYLASVALVITSWILIPERMWVCIISLVLLHIPLVIRLVFKLHIPSIIHISILLFIVTSPIFGRVWGLYETTKWFDKTLHALSGVLVAVIGFSIIYIISNKHKIYHPFLVAFFAFCFSLSVAVLWEMFEFFIDITFDKNMQRGLTDTMIDLCLAVAGAFLVCSVGWIWMKITGKKILPISKKE